MRRTQLDAFLESAFRIRKGEAARVGLLFIYLMGVVSTFILGRTIRDTLFLSRCPLERLPLMYIAVALSVALVSYGYSRVADELRRDRLIISTLLLFAAVFAGMWAVLTAKLAGDWIYTALYIAVEIIGAISIIQFWTFANDLYSSREAKRLFGVIGAGGVASNIICGFTIGKVAPSLGAENLLLACAALLVICVLAVSRIARHSKGELEQAVKKPRKSRIGLAAESGRVLHSRHLQMIAALVSITFLTVTIIDSQFKMIAKSHYSEAQLAAYFGYFHGFTGIISSLVQAFVTSRILERAGIVVSLAVLPVALLCGTLGLLSVPWISPLVAVTIAKGAENVFRYTINDATTQLLYVPVPSHYRGRAKAFIDGILKPVSQGSAGLLLLFMGTLGAKESLALRLSWVDLVLVTAWILLVIGIRREYVQSLISTLHSRRLDLNGPWRPIADEATVRMLKRTLSADEESHVLHALELVTSVDADFQAELFGLLAHPSKRVRVAALRLIGGSGRFDHAHAIHALFADESEEVRAAAIGAFCAIGRERAIRAATPLLSDPSTAVRGAAVAALIKHGGLDGILTAAEALKSFLKSEDPQHRVQAARVLAEIKVRNFFQPVLELLQDPDPRVRVAAVEAAGAMQSLELVPALVYKLAHPDTAHAAMRALSSYGTSIERTLFRVLENKDENIVIRRRVPRVLAQIGGQEAADALMATIDAKDPELRVALARAVAKIRERAPRVRVDDRALDLAIRGEIREAYQTLAVVQDLGLEHGLLPEALLGRHRARLGLAFRLLEIRYPSRTIQLVYVNLDAENKAVRANALEVVDNILSKDESRLLLPLLEDVDLTAKVRAGAELFPLVRRSRDEWLAELLEDPHPWLVACTLHLVAESAMVQLGEAAARHARARDPVVRETACFTLARLLGGGSSNGLAAEARRVIDETAQDNVPEVRRASSRLMHALEASPSAG